MTGEELRAVDLGRDIAWHGVVSIEVGSSGAVQPWRLPHHHRALFPGGDLLRRARMPAGVSLAMRTDARHAELDLEVDDDCSPVDVVAGGRVLRVPVTSGPVAFELPGADGVVELWLPHYGEVRVRGLRLDARSRCEPVPPTGSRWVTHGSSITQRRHAPDRWTRGRRSSRGGWGSTFSTSGSAVSACATPPWRA